MAIFRYISVSAALAAVLAATMAACAFGAQAALIDGKVVDGALAGRVPGIVFNGPSESLALAAIARVTFHQYRQSAPLVAGAIARDGSSMRGKATVSQQGDVEVASARLGARTLKAADVAEVRFECRRPFPPGAAAGVLLANGDFVAADAVTLAQNAVRIKSNLGSVEVPFDRVAAVRLANASGAPVESSVVCENGDLVNGRLAEASADAVTVDSPFGQVAVPLEQIVEVDFPPRMAYISDLKATVKTVGFAPEGPQYWQGDSSPGDDALWSATSGYRKGVFTRAGAAVTLSLPEGAQTLRFVPEIARGANPSSGRFSLSVAGKEVWARPMSAGMKAEPVTISIAGAKEVTLVYASTPEGLIGSAGIWGDAFVTISAK